MKTKGNVVLITGGATGIGLALTASLVKAGNQVLICGRRLERLESAKKELPQIQFFQCDVSQNSGRQSLVRWINQNHPDLNILINNAGIQRAIDLTAGKSALLGGEDEIKTNFMAPVHLSAALAPLLMHKGEAAIINVSSGLGFVPIAAFPVYCATKAGIHMFSVSLRHQMKETPVKVFEIVPPAVDTELGKGTTGDTEQEYRGIPASQVAAETLKALKVDQYEIVIGEAQGLVEGARTDFAKAFKELNSW